MQIQNKSSINPGIIISLSICHCLLQFREDGHFLVYLFDLGLEA